MTRVDLSKLPYKEYLQTDHWKKLRREKLEQSRFKCQLCSSNKELHIHHNTYERRGYEYLSDLVVLCSECHAKFHGIIANESDEVSKDENLDIKTQKIFDDDQINSADELIMTNLRNKDYGYFTMIDKDIIIREKGTPRYDNVEKMLLVMQYIMKYKNLYNSTDLSLEKIITRNGLKLNARKGKTNEQFKDALIQLKQDGYIAFEEDNFKPKDCIEVIPSMEFEHGYVQLYDYEVDKIINYDGKENNFKLLLLYTLIKARCWRRENGGDLTRDGGKEQVCYPSLELISSDTGLSKTTIVEYTKILEMELNLISTIQPPDYIYKNAKGNDYIKSSVKGYLVNIYCNFDDVLIQHELVEWEKDHMENKYGVQDREYIAKTNKSENNRKFNSTLGGLRSAKKRGTISEDGLKKLKEMESLKDATDETCYKCERDFRKDIEESKKHNEKIDVESIEKSSTLANEFIEDETMEV